MKLIPKEIEAIQPPLYSQENVPDPVAVVKFFDPHGRFTFYVLEGCRHPDGNLLIYGFYRSPMGPECDDFGHITLDQLGKIRGPFGLWIERDIHFQPKRLSKIKKKDRDILRRRS